MEKRHRGFLKARRPLNVAVLFAALVLSATCGDSPAALKSGPAHASFAVAPSFAPLPAGAPTIPLSKVQALLTGQHGEAISHEAPFSSGVATLTFDVTITGSSATFEVDYAAFDLQGVVAFRGHQTITIRAGLNASLPSPTLIYDAPDAKITQLRIAPNPINVAASATTSLSATGTLPNGQTLTPRVAWTSSNSAVAAVSADGVLTAGQSQGTATITATSANGLTATAPVKVQAPVDRITVNPATLSVLRGNTATVTADIRDATNAVIDDRTPVWTSSDPTVATVSNAGVISGLKLGKATITATLEGKSGSTSVSVVLPIDHIELSPASLNFPSLKTSLQLTATAVAPGGGTVTGLVPEFRSSNTSVATVDSKGLVTSVANGTASITAEIEGVTASASVTVQQAAAVVSIQPRVASVSALGATTTFTASVVDAANNPLASPTVTWTSSDPTVATVTGTGLAATVTGLKTGSATITATVNGKSDAVSFIVAPAAQLLVIQANTTSLAIGKFAVVRAFMADANRNPLFEVPATFSTTTPNVISIDGNVVVGRSSGVGRVVATYNNVTATLDITVQGGNGITITPDSVEKLPGGTQQFTVAQAGEGSQFTWSVNGIPGGSETFGTITETGFYTAPRTKPTPSTFQVCASQALPPLSGCAKVTIQEIPSSGGEIIVLNDINVVDNGGSVNAPFFRNLINFSAPGPRAKQTGFLIYRGNGSKCQLEGFCLATNWGVPLASALVGTGFQIVDENNTGARLTSIAPNVKAIMLLNPTVAFENSEINVLKQFASEGGRVIFVGEHFGYYGAYIDPVENTFLQKMGAVLRNPGNAGRNPGNGVYACPGTVTGSGIRQHQLTTGLTAVAFACSTEVELGPNDFAVLTYVDQGFERVLVATAKVDLTPLPVGVILNRVPSRSIRPAPASAPRIPPAGPGVPGWRPK